MGTCATAELFYGYKDHIDRDFDEAFEKIRILNVTLVTTSYRTFLAIPETIQHFDWSFRIQQVNREPFSRTNLEWDRRLQAAREVLGLTEPFNRDKCDWWVTCDIN